MPPRLGSWEPAVKTKEFQGLLAELCDLTTVQRDTLLAALKSDGGSGE